MFSASTSVTTESSSGAKKVVVYIAGHGMIMDTPDDKTKITPAALDASTTIIFYGPEKYALSKGYNKRVLSEEVGVSRHTDFRKIVTHGAVDGDVVPEVKFTECYLCSSTGAECDSRKEAFFSTAHIGKPLLLIHLNRTDKAIPLSRIIKVLHNQFPNQPLEIHWAACLSPSWHVADGLVTDTGRLDRNEGGGSKRTEQLAISIGDDVTIDSLIVFGATKESIPDPPDPPYLRLKTKGDSLVTEFAMALRGVSSSTTMVTSSTSDGGVRAWDNTLDGEIKIIGDAIIADEGKISDYRVRQLNNFRSALNSHEWRMFVSRAVEFIGEKRDWRTALIDAREALAAKDYLPGVFDPLDVSREEKRRSGDASSAAQYAKEIASLSSDDSPLRKRKGSDGGDKKAVALSKFADLQDLKAFASSLSLGKAEKTKGEKTAGTITGSQSVSHSPIFCSIVRHKPEVEKSAKKEEDKEEEKEKEQAPLSYQKK